jgi:hypothetical protein
MLNIHHMYRLLLVALLLGCALGCKEAQPASDQNTNSDKMATNAITVVGLAGNAKLGAHLATETDAYYIDGLAAWPAELVDQRVSVTGIVKTVEHRAEDLTNDKGEISQGMVGTQKIITHATWHKVE